MVAHREALDKAEKRGYKRGATDVSEVDEPRGHSMTDTALDHLMTHIAADSKSKCWNWTGTIKPDGYTKWNRVPHVNISAHRVSWLLFNGAFPEPPLTIDHLCRNPRCVNPSHMEPVPIKENVMRGNGLTAQNARKSVCSRGHAFTRDNTRITHQGYRNCRECLRITGRARWHRNNP